MGSWSNDQVDLTGAAMPSRAAPDLGDQARKARSKTLLSASMQRGSASTFVTGSRGVKPAAATPQLKTLLGQ